MSRPIGYKHSEETKLKIKLANTGKKRSEEMKRKISLSLKGRVSSCGMLGKTLSKESRKKISDALKGRRKEPLTEELKKRLSNAHKGQIPWIKGRHHTEEVKIMLSGEMSTHWKGGMKSAIKRKNYKRRLLEFSPLNNYFCSSDGHHIDHKNVLFIPTELHKSVPHDLSNSDSMRKINILAFDWWAAHVL